MLRNLEWFQQRLGTKVLLKRHDIPTKKTQELERLITQSNINYLMDIQDENNSFTDPFTDDKPVLRIHQGNQEECESCSA